MGLDVPIIVKVSKIILNSDFWIEKVLDNFVIDPDKPGTRGHRWLRPR